MMETILKAVIGITVIASGWLTVQIAWRRMFSEISALTDSGTNGVGCRGCGRTNCETRTEKQDVETPTANQS